VTRRAAQAFEPASVCQPEEGERTQVLPLNASQFREQKGCCGRRRELAGPTPSRCCEQPDSNLGQSHSLKPASVGRNYRYAINRTIADTDPQPVEPGHFVVLNCSS
jgi:hypothetical protein